MKRLLLSVTLMTMLATLMIGTAGHAKDLKCPPDCAGDPDVPEADNIEGNDDPNLIHGYGGNDVIHGNGGNDELRGNGGNDRIYGEEGNDKLIGGNGDDYLDGGPGNDRLSDTQGEDTREGTVMKTYYWAASVTTT